MIPAIRSAFNKAFTKEKYAAYLQQLHDAHPGQLDFRVAETPVFIDKAFKHKMLNTCESIIDVIVAPDFKERTKNAVPPDLQVPNENDYSHFIAFDFGICTDDQGNYVPQLIEMQGFPTLFAYQIFHSEVTNKHFHMPSGYSTYLNGYDKESYIQLLKEIILEDKDTENTILLEIYPDQQKTRIDFCFTKDYIGIPTICLTSLKADGKHLYYEENGKKIQVQRIYNRLIFDDLKQQSLPPETIDLTKDWNVAWCPHPAWFYRISKYTLPLINSPYVPYTQYLDKVEKIPDDLQNYVLKPLFSFAGQGVVIDISPQDISMIKNPHNWILQRKVQYADAIQTPDVAAKAEIRIFYFWRKGEKRPVAAQNLARLSKGKMIGVRYNANKEWVGGSLAYFEKD